MALADLLYRCPACGQDPVDGDGDLVTCPGCGARFRREKGSARIRAEGAGEWDGIHHPAALTGRIDRMGGPVPAATRPDGTIRFAARPVHRSRLDREDPVRRGGRLLGFAERMGPEVAGELRVDRDGLSFVAPAGEERWPFREIGSVQVASAVLQIRPRGGTVVGLRLEEDSPYRWEALVTGLLREALEGTGGGTVVELQPRVVQAREEA